MRPKSQPVPLSGVFGFFKFAFQSSAGMVGVMAETEEFSIGFFDESGTHASSKVTAVGGWVATPEEWESFDERWKAALKAAGVQVFHFTDFDNGRGEFEGWSAWRKRNLIEVLIRIICRHDLNGFCGLVEMPEYRDVVAGTGSVLEKKHSPYIVCQQYIVEMISKRIPLPVMYVFEEQREFRSFALQNFWDTKQKFRNGHLKWLELYTGRRSSSAAYKQLIYLRTRRPRATQIESMILCGQPGNPFWRF